MRLAELAGGVVINADASQVYRDLRVLSARPDAADEARAPHRLFGHRDAALPCSAAAWALDARAELEAAWRDRKLPILVGGTGLYIRTLIFGIAPVPEIDAEVRRGVRALPTDAAYSALLAEDPAMAHLRPSDSTRIARALEVIRSTGRSIAQWRKQPGDGIANSITLIPLILLPPRDWLRHRCDMRFERMLEQGAVEEVIALRERALNPALPAMRAIGVPEISAWLDGTIDRPTLIARGQASTRQYAKRQYTWFRHQPPADWPRLEKQLDDNILGKIAIKLRDETLTG